MNANAQRRSKQIDDKLAELAELSLTPGITGSQRNSISVEVKKLLDERENLEDNRNHWLAETYPSLGPVIKLVQKEIQAQSKILSR